MKRTFDFLSSLTALLFFSLPMLSVAIFEKQFWILDYEF